MLAAVICEGAEDKRYNPIDKTFLSRTEGAKLPICKQLTLMTVRLPYSISRLQKMPKRLLLYIIRRRTSAAEHCGAIVIFSAEIRKMIIKNELLYKAFGKYTCTDKKYMCFFMPDIMRRLAPRCGIDPMRARVCISERKAGRISESLIRKLCFDVKKLTLCTDDMITGSKICKIFAEETGFLIDTVPSDNGFARNADILLDLNNDNVRIGRDLLVDGVEINCNKFGTKIETGDILRLLPEGSMLCVPIAYLSGKNRLTLE